MVITNHLSIDQLVTKTESHFNFPALTLLFPFEELFEANVVATEMHFLFIFILTIIILKT